MSSPYRLESDPNSLGKSSKQKLGLVLSSLPAATAPALAQADEECVSYLEDGYDDLRRVDMSTGVTTLVDTDLNGWGWPDGEFLTSTGEISWTYAGEEVEDCGIAVLADPFDPKAVPILYHPVGANSVPDMLNVDSSTGQDFLTFTNWQGNQAYRCPASKIKNSDSSSNCVTYDSLPQGGSPVSVEFNGAAGYFVVANGKADSITVHRMSSDTLEKTFSGYDGARDVALDPATHVAYIGVGNAQKLVVVDIVDPDNPSKAKVADTIDLPFFPRDIELYETPSGQKQLVTMGSDGDGLVYFYDVDGTEVVLEKIYDLTPYGIGSGSSLSVHPDGSEVYVARSIDTAPNDILKISTDDYATEGIGAYSVDSDGGLATACRNLTEPTPTPEATPDQDDDGDGWTEDEGDCDDGNPAIHPQAKDDCDNGDEDCDGQEDEDGRRCDDEATPPTDPSPTPEPDETQPDDDSTDSETNPDDSTPQPDETGQSTATPSPDSNGSCSDSIVVETEGDTSVRCSGDVLLSEILGDGSVDVQAYEPVGVSISADGIMLGSEEGAGEASGKELAQMSNEDVVIQGRARREGNTFTFSVDPIDSIYICWDANIEGVGIVPEGFCKGDTLTAQYNSDGNTLDLDSIVTSSSTVEAAIQAELQKAQGSEEVSGCGGGCDSRGEGGPDLAGTLILAGILALDVLRNRLGRRRLALARNPQEVRQAVGESVGRV